MDKAILEKTAQQMVVKPKGLLAIDESQGTCEKRFTALGIECTEQTRQQYRQLLVTAPGIEQFVSGYILYDETIRQKTDDGIPFAEVLVSKGILPGIKVDQGKDQFGPNEEETLTKGNDGLAERLEEYKQLGAKFAKWRAAIAVSDTLPSTEVVQENMKAMAQYAKTCQEAGIVPIVEPEMLIDGNYSIDRSEEVSGLVWDTLFQELNKQEVYLPGCVLKTSMVISGKDASDRAGRVEVAKRTVGALKKHVPQEIGGIVFLSGGQGDEEATEHLNLMNQEYTECPWALTFSYGRSIQRPALEIWANDMNKVEKAQNALIHRAEANSRATEGTYTSEFEENRGY